MLQRDMLTFLILAGCYVCVLKYTLSARSCFMNIGNWIGDFYIFVFSLVVFMGILLFGAFFQLSSIFFLFPFSLFFHCLYLNTSMYLSY